MISSSSTRNNGRVNILQPPSFEDRLKLYDRVEVEQPVTYRDALEGIWTTNELSDKFFDKNNINHLQKLIQYGVFKYSNGQYKISIQPENELKIIMRSIYLQHSKNLPYHIQDQINALNKLVLNYCIPQIYSEAKLYKGYLKDVSNLPMPINNPINTSIHQKETYAPKWF